MRPNETPEWSHLQELTRNAAQFIQGMEESGQASVEFVDEDHSIHLPLQIGIEDGVVYVGGALFAVAEDSRFGRYFARMMREQL